MNVGVICEFCWTEVEQQRDALRYYRSCTDALIMLSIMAVPTKEISNIVLNKIIINIFRITFGIIFLSCFWNVIQAILNLTTLLAYKKNSMLLCIVW